MEATLLFIVLGLLTVVFFYHDRQKAQIEKRLYRLAYVDRLTGLGNERRMIADLRASLLENPKQALTIVSVDIASLKQINQIMGFEYGTNLICSLGEELKLRLEGQEGCYRINGDVFSLILVSRGAEEDWLRLEELLLSISMMYSETHNHQLHFACGAYTIDWQALDEAGLTGTALREALSDNRLEELCSNADLARKRGKKDGTTTLSFYTEEMLARLMAERELEEAMLPAMLKGEFVMYYQPKYTCSLKKPRLYGAEALVRWQHPQHGLMSPGRFIPLFERDGKSPIMDEHIMELVCRQIAAWLDEGLQLVPISVNVSRQTLMQGEKFLRETEELLAKYHIPQEYIEIEVLESGSAENESTLTAFLRELRARGFRIDMDDFGSGYSSLGALAHMPIDCLKLDRSFFLDWSEDMDKKDTAIVRNIINMAHDMDKVVVAEGVEEQFQVELLEEFGADVIQGYYFSKPLPAEEFALKMQGKHAGGEQE